MPPSIAAMQDRRVELLHDKVMKIIVQGTILVHIVQLLPSLWRKTMTM